MKKFIQVTSVAIVAIIMSGCASTDANLTRETARSIGGNVSPEQVIVTNVDRGMTSVTWKATAPTGSFDCSADDMVRRVLCVKK
jgi:PBP1b-binding outer membrane lipoprotein LpoB